MADRHSVNKENIFSIRPFVLGDEKDMADLIAFTLKESNGKDYSAEYIEGIINSYSPESIAQRAEEAHFHVICDRGDMIACGGITGYEGSIHESYLVSIFVHPDYQGRGLGKKIMEVLESDEYFKRARRTELASSITAAGFYHKLGYEFKNGVTEPDESGVIRMEKKNAD